MKSPTSEHEIDLPFPIEGLNEQRGYMRQRFGTTVDCLNVRAFDSFEDRSRGGQRSGLTKLFRDRVVDDAPIQCIEHLVTNDVVATTATIGQFSYGLTAANGFGVGNSAGTSVFTADAQAGYQFACSCWDEDGYVYIGQINTTTGATRIHKYTAAGVAQGSSWPNTKFTIATGSLRALAGMVVIGDYLYVAMRYSGSPVGRIHKIHKDTGDATTASFFTTTSVSGLVFSTGSKNCLGKCGNVLGAECIATGSAQAFKQFDVENRRLVKNTPYSGTATNGPSRVVSDGIAFFYVIASVTSSKIKKIDLAGNITWSSTAADTTPTGMAYDYSTGKLFVSCSSTPSIRQLSLTAGSLTSSADPESVTNYSWIDGDNKGFFTLYRDGVASNDILGVNSTISTVWGPTTFANTTHSGASVNKGKVVSAITSGGSRQIRPIAINAGECQLLDLTAVDPGPAALTGGTTFNASTPVIWGAQNGLDMYLVDGSSYRLLDSETNAITAWVATAGTLPVDDLTACARGIATWRSRTFLYDFPKNPQTFYLSKQFDPLDWDYSPATTTDQQAFGGTAQMANSVPDTIRTVIPYTDDVCLLGCDHSMWQITGDPMVNGSLDMLSPIIGTPTGRPWAIGPDGVVYLYANHGAVFRLSPNSSPMPMSQEIKRRLEKVDIAANIISLVWDLKAQGLWVFISPLNPKTETTHYFWEQRTNAWFPFQFANLDHNPLAVHVFDGDSPDDRIIMLGGRDGRIRYIDEYAIDDDGTKIGSHVFLGPISTKMLDEIMVRSAQPHLGADSGDVRWDIYVGDSAESAYRKAWDEDGNALDGQAYGTYRSGRNSLSMIQRSGVVAYLKLSATSPWALERLTMHYKILGPVRRRHGVRRV